MPGSMKRRDPSTAPKIPDLLELSKPRHAVVIVKEPVPAAAPVQDTPAVREHEEARAVAEQVLSIYLEAGSPYLKKILFASLKEMRDELRYVALLHGGFNVIGGKEYDVYRARVKYCTGAEVNPNARCSAITKMGPQCKNRPMIGCEHCGTTGHATREELERVHQYAAIWGKHFANLVAGLGLNEIFHRISIEIEQHQESLTKEAK